MFMPRHTPSSMFDERRHIAVMSRGEEGVQPQAKAHLRQARSAGAMLRARMKTREYIEA